MAIGLNEFDDRKTKELLEIASHDRLQTLETTIDREIVTNGKKKKKWFSKKIKFSAKFYLSSEGGDNRKTFWALIGLQQDESFLDRYRTKGLNARYTTDGCSIRLLFWKIIDPADNIEKNTRNKQQELALLEIKAAATQEQIKRLKLEIQEAEARLQLSETAYRGLLTETLDE